MDTFETKAEAQKALDKAEESRARCLLGEHNVRRYRSAWAKTFRSECRAGAAQHEAEAAEIRALLPTLPEAAP